MIFFLSWALFAAQMDSRFLTSVFGLSKIANILRDLTKTSPSGFQQVWFSLQLKKLRSVIICVAYRPRSSEDFISSYSEALLLRKDIIIADDLNCNLLVNWPGLPAVSIQSGFDTSLFADVCTRLKERRIFTQNVSLFKRKLYLK